MAGHTATGRAGIDMLERLLNLCRENPITGCWDWVGYIGPTGYGKFRYNGVVINAHRASYFLHTKKNLESKFQVHHLCENKKCVKPSHLEPMIQKDHTAVTPNSVAYKHSHKTVCPLGHTYDSYQKNGPRFRRSCRTCGRLRYAYRRDKSLGLAVPNSWKNYQPTIIASSTRG